jgi:hypothetical protein
MLLVMVMMVVRLYPVILGVAPLSPWHQPRIYYGRAVLLPLLIQGADLASASLGCVVPSSCWRYYPLFDGHNAARFFAHCQDRTDPLYHLLSTWGINCAYSSWLMALTLAELSFVFTHLNLDFETQKHDSS